MTMTRPISQYLAPAVLLAGGVLAAVNWYLQPERAVTWITAVVTVLALAVIWSVVTLVPRSIDDGARRHTHAALGGAIAWGGFIMAFSLGVKLAAALGLIDAPDLARRTSNVVAGLILVFMGNQLPKLLTPLAVLQCSGARVQAFQRLAGWMFVLTGLAYATVWLVFSIDVANPVSLVILVGCMLIVATRLLRLRRPGPRPREA